MNDNKKKIIQKLLNVKDVNDKHLQYYYLDKNVYCCNINIEPLFDNIQIYDFYEPIRRLAEYYKNDQSQYYIKLLERTENKIKRETLFIKGYDYDLDQILLEYIKCFKKSSLLVVWPIANIRNNIKETKFYKILGMNGKIHAIKEINLTKNQVQGVIYQIYYDKNGFKNLEAIKNKQSKSKANDKNNNKFYIIFYQANNFYDISGKDAPMKVKLRWILREESNEPKDTKLNLFLHITDNHTQVVELTQLFCNKNSLRVLQYQRLDRILYKHFYKSYVNLMTFKNWLYQNIHPIDHIRFLLTGSIILYSLGLRDINDVDIHIFHSPREDAKTPNFINLIDEYLLNSKTRFIGLEVGIKKPDGWYVGDIKYDYMEQWTNKEWPNLYGATSMDETIMNPKFHYYYFGLKMIIIKADIKRRIKRTRAAAYADLIAIMKLIGVKIKIPPLPEGYWSAHVYYDFTPERVNKLYKTIKLYLRKRYNMEMDIDEIKKIIKQN